MFNILWVINVVALHFGKHGLLQDFFGVKKQNLYYVQSMLCQFNLHYIQSVLSQFNLYNIQSVFSQYNLYYIQSMLSQFNPYRAPFATLYMVITQNTAIVSTTVDIWKVIFR